MRTPSIIALCFTLFCSCTSSQKSEDEGSISVEQLLMESYETIAKENIDNYPKAETQLRSVLDQDSLHSLAYHNLLYLLAIEAQWDDFCEIQQRLAYVFPKEAVYTLRSGMCRELQGDSLQALDLYASAYSSLKLSIENMENSDTAIDTLNWRAELMTEAIAARMMYDDEQASKSYQKLINNSVLRDSFYYRQMELPRSELFQFMFPNTALNPEEH
jgi:hypothetical protein